jgi:anti-anti-sigma regulatory factor
VDCLIDHVDEPNRRVVRIVGRLAFPQVADLNRVCDERAGRQLVLDLTELLHADSIGVEALRSLRRGGATLVKMSEYMRLKLEA